MKKLKIQDTVLENIRGEYSIREDEKVIILGEKAYIVSSSYKNIQNIEEDLSIEAPYQLEPFECFIIE